MAGRHLALLIGNGSFGEGAGLSSLRCPAEDVKALSELLSDEKHGGYEVISIVDGNRQTIERAIWEILSQKATGDDLVMLYYSGHGTPDLDGSLFLAASDTVKQNLPITAVQIDFLVARMRSSKCQKIVLILDCCFSGSIERALKGAEEDQVKAVISTRLSGTGSYVLTASTDIQVAEERAEDQYSLLTKHILSGISDGTADCDDDGVITMHELVMHVQESVRREGAQEPLGFALRMNGGELPVARTGKPANAVRRRAVEEAILRLRAEKRLSMKEVVSVATMVSEEAMEEQGPSAKKRLNRLYHLLNEPDEFCDEVRRLYLGSLTESPPLQPLKPQTSTVSTTQGPESQTPPIFGSKVEQPGERRSISRSMGVVSIAVVLCVLGFAAYLMGLRWHPTVADNNNPASVTYPAVRNPEPKGDQESSGNKPADKRSARAVTPTQQAPASASPVEHELRVHLFKDQWWNTGPCRGEIYQTSDLLWHEHVEQCPPNDAFDHDYEQVATDGTVTAMSPTDKVGPQVRVTLAGGEMDVFNGGHWERMRDLLSTTKQIKKVSAVK